MANGHGGKRAGQRPPTGLKWPKTLEKEKARELTRIAITAALQPLIDAQVANAQGLKYLVARDVKGKFERIGPGGLDAANANGLVVEVWEKDPSVLAFQELLNRALDKPAQHVQVTGKDEGPVAFKWQP